MPKIIELTVEIVVQRVSCPGVWLCQDGRVSLTVYALGTSYQTCMLPPIFPLMFRDIFYFRKKFQETCALNNICCLLKNETIYCELVQWCQDCVTSECVILAQYLGSLNDVLFPPNMCTSDGVDLLMRRSKEFPGILAPKIEIATKVRIDEVWNERPCTPSRSSMKMRPCHCGSADGPRQKPVCHSAQYHRTKCVSPKRQPSMTPSRSRSRSGGSRSCCSLQEPKQTDEEACRCPNPYSKILRRNCVPTGRNDYCVYNVKMPKIDNAWRNAARCHSDDYDDEYPRASDLEREINEDLHQKITLESRFIDEEMYDSQREIKRNNKTLKQKRYETVKPCVCEICRRYHELFHTDCSKS